MIKSPGYKGPGCAAFAYSSFFSYPVEVIVSELGWKLTEQLVNDKSLDIDGASRRLVLYSPYVNWPVWELAENLRGNMYLNKIAIDEVMILNCPEVIKNALMAYVMQGMI